MLRYQGRWVVQSAVYMRGSGTRDAALPRPRVFLMQSARVHVECAQKEAPATMGLLKVLPVDVYHDLVEALLPVD